MPHCTPAPCACGRLIRIEMQDSDIVGSSGTQWAFLNNQNSNQWAICLLAQTLSKCGRRCPFQRPTAAQWSQSWQRRAPEDRVVSIRSGTTEIILKLWWSKKKSSPCSYQVHVWILCAWACGAPFYGVDLLLMSLERVNGCNLIV